VKEDLVKVLAVGSLYIGARGSEIEVTEVQAPAAVTYRSTVLALQLQGHPLLSRLTPQLAHVSSSHRAGYMEEHYPGSVPDVESTPGRSPSVLHPNGSTQVDLEWIEIWSHG
jgi:hypothetical protein